MARGIVVKKPGGMDAGFIIVSSGSDSGNGGTAAAVDAGVQVAYTETSPSEIGDLVDFAFDGKLASAVKTAKGTVLSGVLTDNVKVGPNDVTTINAATLDGRVVVKGGVLVVLGSYISGKLDGNVTGSFILVDQQSTIDGKMEVKSASTVSVRNSTIDGKLLTDGTNFTAVSNCTIKGKLKIVNAKDCYSSGNTIDSGTEGSCRS